MSDENRGYVRAVQSEVFRAGVSGRRPAVPVDPAALERAARSSAAPSTGTAGRVPERPARYTSDCTSRANPRLSLMWSLPCDRHVRVSVVARPAGPAGSGRARQGGRGRHRPSGGGCTA